MDFDGWNPDTGDGIAERDAGVSIGSRVQDDDIEFTFRLLNPGDQLAFEVGLAELDFRAQLGGAFADLGLDLGQGSIPVELRLPLTEQVEIGAVEEKNFHAG